MKKQITFRHMNSSASLQDAAESTIEKINKFNDEITSVDITFNNEAAKTVDIKVRVNGSTLAAKEESEELHKSLGEAEDKIIRQLRKWKTKHKGI